MGNHDAPVFSRSINLVKFYMKISGQKLKLPLRKIRDTTLMYMLTLLQSEQLL